MEYTKRVLRIDWVVIFFTFIPKALWWHFHYLWSTPLWYDGLELITKRTVNICTNMTSHLNPLNLKKVTKYDVGNPGPSVGQVQKVCVYPHNLHISYCHYNYIYNIK